MPAATNVWGTSGNSGTSSATNFIGTTDAQATYTRRMDKCVTAGSSGGLGGRENEDTGNIYQITALASDDPDNPSASAVVDTIYIP
jgi:type IV pilus assembly protein PilX